MEEKCKKITNMIKEQKSKGVTQRSNIGGGGGPSMHVNDDSRVRLEEELKKLESDKVLSEKKYKQ
jgi:hypothetical protein